MTRLRIRRRLLTWGHGYGIRITRTEARALGAQAKTPVDVEVRAEPARFDPSRFRTVRLGKDASARHTELAAEAADAGG